MPKYHIVQRREAWQIYTATVIAKNPAEALQKARNDDIVGEWKTGDIEEFDDRRMSVHGLKDGVVDYTTPPLASDD